MSDRDRNILSKLELSPAEYGNLIGRKRQSVWRGLKSDYHYIGLDDLVRLFDVSRAKPQRARIAERLRDVIAEHFGTFYDAMFKLSDGSPEWSALESREVWIVTSDYHDFANRHQETANKVLSLMRSNATVIFVVPPGRPYKAACRFVHDFERRENRRSGFATTFECALVELAPFLLFVDPLGPHPSGYTLCARDQFVALDEREVEKIVRAFTERGMRMDSTSLEGRRDEYRRLQGRNILAEDALQNGPTSRS